MTPSYREIVTEGLWARNPGLVQLLGLCPLLAVSRTLVSGLALGIASLGVVTATNVLVSSTRSWLVPHLRLPVFVLIIATFVTTADLLFKAYWFDLYLDIGLFVPLIVTNCAILGRAEAFASRQPVLPALVDGLAQGAGFTLLLVGLGTVRELLGQGTLLADVARLLGPQASNLTLQLLPGEGFLLALLPPGAFFALGLFVAARQALVNRQSPDRAAGAQTAPTVRA